MSKKPVLVVMAAGMGSRFGGLKQMEPVDSSGHSLLEYSIFDAKKAGFEKVIFVLKAEMAEAFQNTVGLRVKRQLEVAYVLQDFTLPTGFHCPADRQKPFGTGHAVLSCKEALKGAPFAVINGDDYYGRHAFSLIFHYLTHHCDDEKYRYAMVGYPLANTLTDHGYVSRGICQVDTKGYLTGITERTHIEKQGGSIAYTEDQGQSWVPFGGKETVSMNLFGFSNSILAELEARFPVFLEENLEKNPLKCEYFLPEVVGALIREGKATVQVLPCTEQWYGMTYPEDKDTVVAALATFRENGLYEGLSREKKAAPVSRGK